MTATKYTKSITDDFNSSYDGTNWKNEINASSIIIQIDHIHRSGDVVNTWFKDVLPQAQEDALDALPAAHNSTPTPTDPLLREDGVTYAVSKPSSYGFEMCDRDFKITPGELTNSVEDLYLDPIDLKEKSWNELSLVGVYKDVDGTMTACTEQSDADANGVLSVWEYKAQLVDTTQIPYELRDGLLFIDSKLPLSEKYDHRAYAIMAPSIPNAYGGSIAVFDSYLGAHPLDEIDAENIAYDPIQALSPQATVLNPAVATGANIIRLYIYHPVTLGSYLSHIFRLVTYRQPTTFR